MKHAPTLALVLAAACAAPQRPAEAVRPRQDLVPLSRAMTAIDTAGRRGETAIAAERQRWSQASQQSPRDPAARFLAVYAQPAGDDRWQAFKDMVSEFPESALGQVGMARTYVGWGTTDQADRAVRAALELEPDCWLAVLVRAEAAERRGRLEAAAADYRTVLGADPENPEARLGLARLARAAGDAVRAEAEAAEALRVAPGHPGALALLAALADPADRARAIERWTAVVDASPRDRAARVTLAKLLLSSDPFGALEQWKAALDLGEDAETLVSIVQAARLSGEAAAESRALERLAVLDPNAAEWRRLAQIRLAANDLDGAEKALRLALAREPRDGEANLGLARVHVARGQPLEAVEAYRAAGATGAAERGALEARLNLERVQHQDVKQLQKAVQALVDRTFRARRAENASLSGTLRLRVTADSAGAAMLVEVLEDTIHDPDVRACAYWNLRDATYPQDKPGRYSFTFSFR